MSIEGLGVLGPFGFSLWDGLCPFSQSLDLLGLGRSGSVSPSV